VSIAVKANPCCLLAPGVCTGVCTVLSAECAPNVWPCTKLCLLCLFLSSLDPAHTFPFDLPVPCPISPPSPHPTHTHTHAHTHSHTHIHAQDLEQQLEALKLGLVGDDNSNHTPEQQSNTEAHEAAVNSTVDSTLSIGDASSKGASTPHNGNINGTSLNAAGLVGQNRIYTMYMTVCLMISLPIILYIYTVYVWF